MRLSGEQLERFERDGFLLLDGLARDPEANRALEAAVFAEVRALTARFPIYAAV
jgi:hypothetical protein